MGSDWRHSTWGEEISLEYGKRLSGYTEGNGTIRVYGTNGPVGWTDAPLAPGPGIIVGRKGAYRGVNFSPAPFYVIDTAYYVRLKTDLHMKWLYYAIIHYGLTELDDGSPIPSTTRSAVYVRELNIPPRVEQEKIADILGSLDDKIELNRQLNCTLEAIAKAIFKAWFLDFEPIKAKVAGATGFRGMPQTVFDQLPERFTDSELGPVPQGWDYVPIGDLVDVIGGGTPSTKNASFWEGGENAFCTPKDLSRLSAPVLLDTERHITQAGVDKISSGQLPVGTVILSSRAPIGYLALAETPVSVNQGIIAMVTGEIPNTYVLLWTQANMEVIESRAGGSTFAEISKKNFKPIPSLRPDETTLKAFDDLVKPLFDRIASNEREAQTLSAIRDTLLPKLISGELRVPVAEEDTNGC